MKRLLVLFFLLIAGPAAASPSDLYVNAPRDGFLNLRAGPGTQYHVIDRMPHRAEVEVLQRGDRWYRVAFGHTIGWAHKRYLDPERHYAPHREPVRHKPRHPKPEFHHDLFKVHVPHHAYLNLRRGPGTEYHVRGRMSHGAKLRVLGPKRGRWAKVEHVRSGYRGWVHTRFIRAY